MSGKNFSEFTRFSPQGLKPLNIQERFCGNLELDQLRKLFNLFKGSLMPSWDIFGPSEGSVFEFKSLVRFEVLENS
jgi:hypothetical protein